MGTQYCVQGGNEDDFLSPCSSLVCSTQVQLFFSRVSWKCDEMELWQSRSVLVFVTFLSTILCSDRKQGIYISISSLILKLVEFTHFSLYLNLLDMHLV